MNFKLFVPVYGPLLEWERLVTSHDEPFERRVGYAIQTGGVSGAHYIFGLRHLAHIQAMGGGSGLNYLHAKSLMNKATRIAPVVAVAYTVTTASVVYEETVNKSIRSGRLSTWFGPFSSGFGTVV